MTLHTIRFKIIQAALIGAAFFILLSCGKTTEQTENSDQEINLELTEFTIEHGQEVISNTFVFTKLIGDDSLVFYEHRERDFYLFDLKNLALVRFLSFQPEGPDFIENHVLDFEKIGNFYAILTANYISISDKNGKIIKRNPINKFLNNMKDPTVSKIHHFMAKNASEMYLAQSPRAVLAPIEDVSINPPIFTVYNLGNDSVVDLPIYSPEETLIKDNSKGYYGSQTEHFFFHKDNCLIYNFQFSPSIYRFCLASKKLTHFDGKTARFAETAEPMPAIKYRDPEYLVKHKLLNGIRFSNIAYDAKSDTYLRFASRKTYNEELNRSKNEVYLQIFDSEFSIVSEEEMLTPVKTEVYVQNGSIYMIGVSSSQSEEGITRFIKYDLLKK